MQKCNPITFGKILGKTETDSFIVTEAKHPSGYRLPKHTHQTMSLACVLSGSFIETFKFKSFECGPQTAVFKPADAVHSNYYQRTGSHSLLIELKNGTNGKPERLSNIFGEIRLVDVRRDFALIKKIHREISSPDDLTDLAVEGLLLELLTNFSRRSGPPSGSRNPHWLHEARDYIHANFRQRMSLSTVAGTVGIHAAHLARVFRREFRCSVGDYIRNLRLEYAAGQLVETDRTLIEIAADAGFYDQSHFTNAFKDHTGTTPHEYRQLRK